MKKIYTCVIAILPLFFFCDLQAQLTGCTSNISPANSSTNVDPFPYITLKWTPVTGATSYDIYVGTKVPPTQLIGTVLTDTFNFINASYNTTYNWYIVPKNASGNAIGCVSTATSFVTSPPPLPPINDNCSGAIDISTVPLNGTTLGATQSQPADLCNGYTGTADDDVWYKFMPPANSTTIITLTGNGSFDGILEAFSGACGSLTALTCSDTSQEGGREQITLNVIAGTTYTLRVYGFYANLTDRGTFSISTMSAPLPVTLLNFSGEHRDNKNLLKWSTATELNNQGFEVQYSTDGNNFDAISFVNSKSKDGNSASVINYEFIDGRTLYGNAYYRLKQVDKDGRPNFSNIIFSIKHWILMFL